MRQTQLKHGAPSSTCVSPSPIPSRCRVRVEHVPLSIWTRSPPLTARWGWQTGSFGSSPTSDFFFVLARMHATASHRWSHPRTRSGTPAAGRPERGGKRRKEGEGGGWVRNPSGNEPRMCKKRKETDEQRGGGSRLKGRRRRESSRPLAHLSVSPPRFFSHPTLLYLFFRRWRILPPVTSLGVRVHVTQRDASLPSTQPLRALLWTKQKILQLRLLFFFAVPVSFISITRIVVKAYARMGGRVCMEDTGTGCVRFCTVHAEASPSPCCSRRPSPFLLFACLVCASSSPSRPPAQPLLFFVCRFVVEHASW